MNWMIKRHPAVLSGPNLPKLKRKHVYNIVNLTVIYVTVICIEGILFRQVKKKSTIESIYKSTKTLNESLRKYRKNFKGSFFFFK